VHGYSFGLLCVGRANLGMFKIFKRLDPGATSNELLPKPKGMH
jgi:hypothetical protein